MDTTPEQISREISTAVRTALTESGTPLRTAATETGIPLTTLQRRLNGTSPFSVTELASLASVTGTTVSALVESARGDAA